MTRLVDLVDERRRGPRTPFSVRAVAGSAIGGKYLLTGFGFG